MKKILIFLFLFFPFTTNANTYIEKTVLWHKIKVIEYNLSSKEYELKIVKSDDATNLWNLLKENNAISWVNWVFFCPTDYDWCNTSKSFTDNERYIVWEKFATYLTTGDRAVFWWTKEKKPFIYQSGKINMDNEDQIYYWLGNYPLLLNEWKNTLEYYYDVWLIDLKMRAQATRNFICSDKEKKNIYFWLVYNATIDDLVQTLSEFWCWDALNLDAWLSTAFIYNNRYIVWPQKRDILDAIAIERKWLKVSEINEVSTKITKYLITEIIKKSKNNPLKAVKITESYIDYFDNYKKQIYQKNSTDIIEKNSLVWEEENVWYKIEINELKTLKLITLINSINENLKKVKKELEKNL